jgi:hypothetical protein
MDWSKGKKHVWVDIALKAFYPFYILLLSYRKTKGTTSCKDMSRFIPEMEKVKQPPL